MRKIYEYMNDDQKKQAISLFINDIELLKKEQEQEEEKGFSRVVRDAIEETIQRYKKDLEYLQNDIKRSRL
ncbi:hypothetical protein HOO54_17180 [Bacillus sp. WMMC1349]|uniref:hypothetical protein n=1 Tax=Bacillus sp. WMMC1349 TaxID=2736254 RepID=UPI0015561568|nr:hypothetical protein [Bacillus sp. WMMC1349]NPC93901.1 hypothetical protein [Bacillus sp. WMMC1349]